MDGVGGDGIGRSRCGGGVGRESVLASVSLEIDKKKH